MRTTIVIPDELFAAVRDEIGQGSFSRFVREALDQRLAALQRMSLVREMEAGYAAEAAAPSLEPEWTTVETEGLG